MSEKLIKH